MQNAQELLQLLSEIDESDAVRYARLTPAERDELGKALLEESLDRGRAGSEDWLAFTRAMDAVLQVGVLMAGYAGWHEDDNDLFIIDAKGNYLRFDEIRDGALSGVFDGVLIEILDFPPKDVSGMLEKLGEAALEIATERMRCQMYVSLPQELRARLAECIDFQVSVVMPYQE